MQRHVEEATRMVAIKQSTEIASVIGEDVPMLWRIIASARLWICDLLQVTLPIALSL